jgi:hypothetical protein
VAARLHRRQWCDFVSFDPRLPEKMRLFKVRLQRDEKRIAELEREVNAFLGTSTRCSPRSRPSREAQPAADPAPAWLKPLRHAITLAMKRARIRRFNHARSARS